MPLTNSFEISVCSSARKIINLTIENQASFKTVSNVMGYLKGKTNPGRSAQNQDSSYIKPNYHFTNPKGFLSLLMQEYFI